MNPCCPFCTKQTLYDSTEAPDCTDPTCECHKSVVDLMEPVQRELDRRKAEVDENIRLASHPPIYTPKVDAWEEDFRRMSFRQSMDSVMSEECIDFIRTHFLEKSEVKRVIIKTCVNYQIKVNPRVMEALEMELLTKLGLDNLQDHDTDK